MKKLFVLLACLGLFLGCTDSKKTEKKTEKTSTEKKTDGGTEKKATTSESKTETPAPAAPEKKEDK
jgi:hypothetical protein